MEPKDNVNGKVCVELFRWDHVDLSYYNATRQILQLVLDYINLTSFDSLDSVHKCAGSIYDRTVNVLQECADLYIPKKGYYKFWWNQELDLLKENAISSN